MEDNMDVDLSGIIEGTKTIEESGKMLLDEIVQVCNGKLTKAEAYALVLQFGCDKNEKIYFSCDFSLLNRSFRRYLL